MQQLLESMHYGNADTSSGLTTFWLRGSLRISAHEHIAFLTTIHNRSLPLSDHALDGLLDIMILAQGPGWTFRGKTGTYSGPVDGIDSSLGWFVGWIERDGRALFFAANDSTGLMGPDVRERVQQVLVDLGELPPDWEEHATTVNLP
jgi:beta-lactamase class D